MTYRDVVRRDLVSTYRARTVPAVAALLLATTLVVVLGLLWAAEPGYPPTMEVAVLTVGTAVAVLVPLVALVATYGALVGERASGSVRFLVGLPNSRLDAYLGKYCARAAVVVGPLATGLVVSAVVVGVAFQDGSTLAFLVLAGASCLYALAFVGLGLAISAVSSTTNRAVAGAVGVYVALRGGWPALQAGLLRLTGAEPYPPFPEWHYWLGRVNPMNAYVELTTLSAEFRWGHLLLAQERGVSTVAVTPEFALVVLLVWAVVPPALGYRHFRDADLL